MDHLSVIATCTQTIVCSSGEGLAWIYRCEKCLPTLNCGYISLWKVSAYSVLWLYIAVKSVCLLWIVVIYRCEECLPTLNCGYISLWKVSAYSELWLKWITVNLHCYLNCSVCSRNRRIRFYRLGDEDTTQTVSNLDFSCYPFKSIRFLWHFYDFLIIRSNHTFRNC